MSLKTIKPIYYIKFLEYTISKIPSKQSGRDRRRVYKLVKKKMPNISPHFSIYLTEGESPVSEKQLQKI